PTSRWTRGLIWTADLLDSVGAKRRRLGMVVSVPLLLAVGWMLRLAPRSWPFETITYLVALTFAVLTAIGTYRSLRVLQGFGALGRWFARSMAGIIAMVG